MEDDIAKVTGSRVRVVVRSGIMVRRVLTKSNPWAGGDCGRKKCLPCLNKDGKTDCFTKNVVYSLECITCEEAKEDGGKKATTCYIGETSRSLHCRAVEHCDWYRGKKENNPMFKHAVDAHGGEIDKVRFRMKILKQHFTAMSRQIHESVAIARRSTSGMNLINSKMEGAYNRCKLPRLTIKGAFDGTDLFVEREPTCKIEIVRDNDRSKAKFGKREKKLAGSSDAGRQSSSQSSLFKYFHSRPAKHR